MESNWTHVPFGYKNEQKLKEQINTKTKTINWENAFETEKHNTQHVIIENSQLKNTIKRQKFLLEDFMHLVDMFATGNVDLKFYKRVREDYLKSLNK